MNMRVVVFKEADKWIAQALERDLRVWSDNEEDIPALFEALVEEESKFDRDRGDAPLSSLSPAPTVFFDMWDNCDKGVSENRSVDGVDYKMSLCA